MKNYGRSSKLLLAAKDIPDLQFDLAEVKEKGESSERTEVVEIIDVNTNGSVMISQNNNFREHSKHLLESAEGEAQEQASEQRSMKKMMDLELHNRTSEYREHSQKSRSSEKPTDEETSRKIVHRMLDKGAHPEDSENREHSQKSLSNGKPKVDTGEVNMSFGAHKSQCLTAASEAQEVSSNLRVESECSQGTHHKQSAKSVCISKPSKFFAGFARRCW